MQRLIILGAVLALAVGRPEMYKEQEDFQYSRSSSDDGTKSGFYGAQRGNMGGNYERAHNMDSLAQNQMSGLVKQTEGELGNGANMRAGSVYTAANSRGSYGSGRYDLSSLGGRNFQEGTFYDNSQARSSQSSSAYNSADYTSGRTQSQAHSGYQTAGQSSLNLQSGDLQSVDRSQGSSQYDYGRHSGGYQTQSGFREHSAYDVSNTNLHTGGYGSNTQTRLISATPVRIIVRPGTRVAVPIAAQTYDVSHGSSLIDHNSLNTEAETLSSDNQHSVYRPSNSKHYETSYNYRKQWEKHDTIPSTVPLPTPTQNSFPANSELYEDSQLHTANGQYDASRIDSQRAHSSNLYSGYNTNVKSSSSQSRSNYDYQHQGAASGSSLNAYTQAGRNTGSNYHVAADSSVNGYSHNSDSRYSGSAADASSLTQAGHNAGFNTNLNSQVEDISGKPKSYQSSYSYHKSWERQGDPYVIKPASSTNYDGQTSQRLTSSTNNAGYAASGSHYQHQGGVDCDETGHIRVARSYNTDEYQQQSQNIEDLGQQVEDLGQQTQGNWDQLETQQSQNSWDKLEDLSQQSQSNLGQQETQQSQSSWDKLEDLSQQSQSNWGQQETQQSQSSWDKLEDLSQQSQSNWGQQETQQTQNPWDKVEDLSQQSQNNPSQQETQQSQNSWDKLEDLSQQSQSNWSQQETQQSQNSWGQQETQQTQNSWDKLEDLNQQHQNDLGQHSQDTGTGSESKPINTGQETHNQWDFSNNYQHNKHEQSTFQQHENSHQINIWNKFDNLNQNVQQNNYDSNSNTHSINQRPGSQFEGMDQQLHNTWGHVDASQSESSYVNTQSNSEHNWYTYNTDQFTHFHEQATSNDSSSHVNLNRAPLSSLWNKLNQQPTVFTDTGIHNIHKGNNVSEIHTSSQNSYESSLQQQNNYLDSTLIAQHHYSQIKPHNDQPQPNPVISSITSEEKERSEDVSRGDIGPEKLSHTSPGVVANEDKAQSINHNHQMEMELSDKELSVVSLDQQKSMNKTDQKIYNGNDLTINKQSVALHDQTNTANNLQTVNQSTNYFKSVNEDHNRNVMQQSSQGFELDKNTEQQNAVDFGQKSLLNFSENENVQQQSLHGFDQHNLQDFGQQTYHDFSQHENSDQQNLHEFGQHENLDQQNLHEFGQYESSDQQNLHEFGQHENLDQQNLQDFGQHVNSDQQNLHEFGQHESLDQQNLQDFGENDHLEQQNLKDFEHQNLQEFEQLQTQEHALTDLAQQESLQQQHLNHENIEQEDTQNTRQQGRERFVDFGQNYYQEQQNVHQLSQKKEHYSNTNVQHDSLAHPQEVEEPIQVQKQNKDLDSNSAVQGPKTEVDTPIEPITEKPGFWKSIGNKFSSAKSKVASWFKS